MFITMADTACSSLLASATDMTLYGPQGAGTFLNALRTFMNLRDVPIRLTEIPSAATAAEQATSLPEPIITNDLVSIHPVVLTPGQDSNGSSTAAKADGSSHAAKRQRLAMPAEDSFQNGAAAPRQSEELSQRWKPSDIDEGQVVTGVSGSQAAVCYVCRLPNVRGKFLPHKAASLGVQRGPLYGELQRGRSVQSANGRIVHPHEVQEPDKPGPTVIVADCPSVNHVPELLRTLPASLFAAEPSVDDNGSQPQLVDCIVHFSPEHVVSDPRYLQWMQSFGQTTHLPAHASTAGASTVMSSSATVHAHLNLLGPAYFRMPPKPVDPSESSKTSVSVQQAAGFKCPGHNLLKYLLVPLSRQGLEAGEVPVAVDAKGAQAMLAKEQPETIVLAAQAMQSDPMSSPAPDVVSRADRGLLEVCFLGTGAAVPSKYRNVTSLYLNMCSKGSMLLDCGEGTLGQLIRLLGQEAAAAALRSLRCIWISHIHADHHAGLARVLSRRAELCGGNVEPLLVLGPRQLKRVLAAYSELEPMHFRWVDCVNTIPGDPEASKDAAVVDSIQAAMASLGLTRLESVPVIHCRHANGIVLESSAGWKFAFSGDTRPCPQMAAAAKDATLLVHEATFEDELQDQAIAKKHSLTREAVDIGRQAGAYRVILTHFSQRYPKVPVIGKSWAETTCIAFDLMTVNIADLPLLPKLVPALELLFKDPDEADVQEPVPEMPTQDLITVM